MIMPKNVFYNDHTVNIFTDASVYKSSEYTNACAGAIAVVKDTVIGKNLIPMYNTTNNRAELTAIILGLCLASTYRLPRSNLNINIFSDSKISVYGIRDWIYSWISNSKNNVLMSTSGEVKNQDLILTIINYIIESQYPISIFHVRGHCDSHKYKDIVRFRKSFILENHLQPNTIEDQLSIYLMTYNDKIDTETRKNLISQQKISEKPYDLDLNSGIPYLNMDKYKEILRRDNHELL